MPNLKMEPFTKLLGLELSPVSAKEKLISTLGGLIAIFIIILIEEKGFQQPYPLTIVASMGASAVLLFAVPHGQLSQPWPVVMGHGLSALIGVTCARFIPMPAFAAALAVGLSIGVMHQFKCIHPPGGATALTAVLGGPAIQATGYGFVFFPVLSNAIIIVAIGFLFNWPFKWRRYPAVFILHKRNRPPLPTSMAPSHSEIVAALQKLDSFVDITENDLTRIVEILRRDEKDALNQGKREEHSPSN